MSLHTLAGSNDRRLLLSQKLLFIWTNLDELTRITHGVVIGIELALYAKYLADLSWKFAVGESTSELVSPPLESPNPVYAFLVVHARKIVKL